MKTFYTDGTGSQQTLNDSQTEKVVVYDTINDAEADLANLAEGQIIATRDDDFEGNAVPVNEVALNNMHSVTSNAVAQKLQSIENLTDSITRNNTYCNYINCFRYGKVVDVYFETKNTSQSNATIATGLPAPKSGYMMYGIEIYGNGSITYTRVESNGNLIAQCNMSYTGIGHITYICS